VKPTGVHGRDPRTAGCPWYNQGHALALPASEGGGIAMTCPFEDWRYSHFEGIGSLTIEFIDPTSSGEYHMTLDPKEKYKRH
jgi:hypothetical protein